MGCLGIVRLDKGANTISFDPTRSRVYIFLPETHRVAIYQAEEKRMRS